MNIFFPDGFEQYLAIETAGGATWHPNGDKIAFIYNQPGHFQIFDVNVKENHTFGQPE